MYFKKLVVYFEKLESTTKRLEMIRILAELFKNLKGKDRKKIDEIIYLSQGRLLPAFKNIEFGISEKLIHKSIAQAANASLKRVEEVFQDTGDYGQTVQNLSRHYEKILQVSEVYSDLEKLALFSGEGAVAKKVEFLAKIFRKVSPVEAKYIVRIILGKLRLGIGDPTVLDGLAQAAGGSKSWRQKLERAYNLCSDLGLVAKILFTKGIAAIEKFKVIVGCPIRMALAARLSSPKEIIEKIDKCAIEAKYDGFRCQVHKLANKVEIFSRNLENTTHMFPEIKAGTIKQIKEKNVIFEGEAIAYNPQTGKCLPFQTTVQRKRKYDIESMQKRFPLRLFVFDILYAGGDLTEKPYLHRRKVMSKIINKGNVLEISPVKVVDSAQALSEIFEEVVAEGREGIMAKRLDGQYQAGGRNFNWIKLKRSYSNKLSDTIDCVIVGYFIGKGLRSVFGIGSLLACVYDEDDRRFKTIAKLGSGMTEIELKRFKKKLDEIKINYQPKQVDSSIVADVWVEPKFVIEVQADEVTKSPVHTCGKKDDKQPGYALRFPRTVGGIRIDKRPEDATSVSEILKMYAMQGRKK